jgi:hypothetical protein
VAIGTVVPALCPGGCESVVPKEKRRKASRGAASFLAYLLGLGCWLAGFHCLQEDGRGALRVSARRFLRHWLKLFLWTFEVALVCRLSGLYLDWLFRASTSDKTTAFLVKSVVFLYLKVFWPRVFPEILPGFHVFFCPQCYRSQTFKFRPVSFQYGFFVTYLCRHCSCLVDAWGGQIFYPRRLSFGQAAWPAVKAFPLVLSALAAGIGAFLFFWYGF